MGKFLYDGMVNVEFDDRLLSHLQVVIGAKLRRGESFPFTWKDGSHVGDGRTSVWIHPRANITYRFDGGRQASINREWVDHLMYTANSVGGLYVVPEPPVRNGPPAEDV